MFLVKTQVLSKHSFGLRPEVWGVVDVITIFSKFFGVIGAKVFKITYIKSIVTSITICVNLCLRLDFLVIIGISISVLVSLTTTTKTLPFRFNRPKSSLATCSTTMLTLAATSKVALSK